MKKHYSSCRAEIIFMSAEDVITSSPATLDLDDYTNGDVVKFGQINPQIQ